MASKVGVFNLRFAKRETFSNLKNGKGQLGKFVLSSLDTCSTWEVTWGQTHSRIQQDAGEFFYPLLALFELNRQILDTRDVNKGQTGLKYKVTSCSMFCLLLLRRARKTCAVVSEVVTLSSMQPLHNLTQSQTYLPNTGPTIIDQQVHFKSKMPTKPWTPEKWAEVILLLPLSTN